VFGGVSAYIMTPYDWAMDKMFGPVDHSDTDRQKAALRNFGKSLVAWDEWGKNPSKAVGIVAFNGLTLGAGSFLKLGKAGKAGLASEAATVMGKAGVLVDPMSYLGKAGSFTKLKIGDLMEGLKASQAGVDDMARNVPTGNSPHPGEVNPPSAHPEGPSSHPAGSGEKAPTGETPAGREYTDPEGNKRVIGNDGFIRDEHGNVVPDTAPHPEPHKGDLPNVKEHETAPVKDESKVLEGAGGPGHVENSANHPTGAGGHAGDHSTGGSGSGAGSHAPDNTGGGKGGEGHSGPSGHEPSDSSHGHDDAGTRPDGHHEGDAAGRDSHGASGADGTAGDHHSSFHGEDATAPGVVDDVSHTMRSDYVAPDDPKSRVPVPPKEPGDIVLSTGDHVYLEPDLTTIGYDEMTQLNRDMTARIEGHHDIIVHGNDKGFFMPGRKNAAGVDFPPGEVSAGHIAEAIRNNPSYKGGPIRLISCHTGVLKEGEVGIPAAQALANEMKVPVTAPTHEVGIYPSRGKGQVPEVQNGGYWRTFLPLLD
ncbi:hypothetical protein ABZ582_12620, partial [Streptomyces syringium]